MEDVKAAGAHTITTSGIFLKQEKKAEGQIDRNKMSEERRGPSREEWNFPQVHRVYVGLAGPKLSKGCCGSQLVAEWGSPSLITCRPYCYLSISFLSYCLLLSLRSHTLNVLMCVQEKKALKGLEGKPGNRPDFPLYHPPSPPPLPPLWWHSFFFSYMEAQNNSGQRWITDIFARIIDFRQDVWKQAYFMVAKIDR